MGHCFSFIARLRLKRIYCYAIAPKTDIFFQYSSLTDQLFFLPFSGYVTLLFLQKSQGGFYNVKYPQDHPACL